MSYLAVPEVPRQGLWASLRRRSKLAEWHAVALSDWCPAPIETLCGFVSVLEAHRTWDQTLPDARCPRCEQLTAAADRARSVMAAAEAGQTLEPVDAQLLERRIMENA
jgi:hypothetical protein